MVLLNPSVLKCSDEIREGHGGAALLIQGGYQATRLGTYFGGGCQRE